jgi:hypothetical protein
MNILPTIIEPRSRFRLPPSRPLRPSREASVSFRPHSRHHRWRQNKPRCADLGEIKGNWAQNKNLRPGLSSTHPRVITDDSPHLAGQHPKLLQSQCNRLEPVGTYWHRLEPKVPHPPTDSHHQSIAGQPLRQSKLPAPTLLARTLPPIAWAGPARAIAL